MSAAKFEAFLAELYVNDEARSRFFADPRGEAIAAGLDVDDCAALQQIDGVGLEMAAESFAHKRIALARQQTPATFLNRLRHQLCWAKNAVQAIVISFPIWEKTTGWQMKQIRRRQMP